MRIISDKAFQFTVFRSTSSKYFFIQFQLEDTGLFTIGPIDGDLNLSNKTKPKMVEGKGKTYLFDSWGGSNIHRAEYTDELLSERQDSALDYIAWHFAKVVHLLGVNIHSLESD